MNYDTKQGVCAGRTVLIIGRCAETIYRQRRALAWALRHEGWTVHLCGDTAIKGYKEKLEAEGFPFHSVAFVQKSKNPMEMMRLLLFYRNIVRSINPDIVHFFNSKPTVFGLLGSALAMRGVRVTTIAGLGHVFMSSSRIVRAAGAGVFRLALTFSDAIIFYNNDDCALFIDMGLVRPNKTYVVPGSGVDLRRFMPAPLPNGDQLEVLFIGRLLREKGIEEVLACGRELKRRGAAVRITVAGDVDQHNPSSLTTTEMERAAEDGGVHWIGSQQDIVPSIRDCDVVLLPSHREGIPLALVEGGAMRRALVTTDVPGCRDVVQDGQNGMLMPVGRIDLMVDALVRLAEDRTLLDRLAGAALEGVRGRYEASLVTAEVGRIYDALLAGQTDAAYAAQP